MTRPDPRYQPGQLWACCLATLGPPCRHRTNPTPAEFVYRVFTEAREIATLYDLDEALARKAATEVCTAVPVFIDAVAR